MTLPKHHHPHDSKWIIEQLVKLPPAYRERAIEAYSNVYLEVHNATEKPHQKDGEARREANTRLRRYIDAVTKNPRTQAGGKGTA